MKRYLFLSVWIPVLIWSGCNRPAGTEGNDPYNAPADTSIMEQKEEIPGQQLTTGTETPDQSEEDIMILISTEFGDMKAILYPETPHHRDNYIKLTREGWYNGSVFHRVINGFMIQGGAGKGGLDTDYRIPAEFVPEYFHKKGAIAAARTGDHVNPARESSGCQFYIVQGRKVTDEEITMTENQGKFKYSDEQREIYRTIGGTPFLDYQYTVFGEVVDGLEVIDRIATVQTDAMDKPLKDVKMNVRIIEKKPQ